MGYTLFEALYLSFYSKRLYREVAATWGGKAFVYAFLILTLAWIGHVIGYQTSINHIYKTTSHALVEQLPVITVDHGKISTPENRPYAIKALDDPNQVIVMIDTSGQYTTLAEANAEVLMTENSIITKSDNETKIYELPRALTYTFVPVMVNEKISAVIGYAWVLMLPFLILASFFVMIIKSLVYALIGRIFSAFTHAGVNYVQCMILYFVSVTPALALRTVFESFSIHFHYQGWLIFAISIAYLFFAILVNKPSRGD